MSAADRRGTPVRNGRLEIGPGQIGLVLIIPAVLAAFAASSLVGWVAWFFVLAIFGALGVTWGIQVTRSQLVGELDGASRSAFADRYVAPPASAVVSICESGPFAKFTYVDADGVVTDREVTNWEYDGDYVKAFCLLRREHRTFRVDRIEGWSEER